MATSDSPVCPARFDPEDLVRHGRFVKQLARELVTDEVEAEELAARTLATAWEEQPQSGPGLRAWFKTVVWRLRRAQRREEQRRTRREQQVALDPACAAAPAAVEVAARLELEHRIAAAFAALEEPYQSTLFLRHFDDLTPTQIAARTGVPVETVKTRLKRGVERLRAALDAMHGEKREGWQAMAVALALQGTPVVAKSKLVPLAVAALLLVGTGVMVVKPWRHAGASDSSAQSDPAHVASAAAGSATGDEQESPTAAVQRAPVAPDPSGLPFAAGVVVDGDGAPIEAVRIVASRLERVKKSTRHFQRGFDVTAVEKGTLATSDVNGRFTVAEPGEDLASLRFFKEGWRLGEWFDLEVARASNQQGRVVLQRARRVRGSVSDTDGKPVLRADLNIWTDRQEVGRRIAKHLADRPEYLVPGNLSAWAGADGRFDVAWIPWEHFGVVISGLGYLPASSDSKKLRDSWDVTLQRSYLLIDAVDAETGEPIPQATAMLVERDGGRVLMSLVPSEFDYMPESTMQALRVPGRLYQRTGFGQSSDGMMPRWIKDRSDHTVDLRVHVFAKHFVSAVVDATVSQKFEPPHLVVDLRPDDGTHREAAIAGRVVGAAHAKLALHSLGFDQPDIGLENRMPLLHVALAADGSFAVPDLPPGRYRIFASAPGVTLKSVDVTAPSGGVVIELAPSATFEFVVKDRTGALVRGARIHVQGEDGKNAWAATTDAQGVAIVDGLPEGSLFVVASEPREEKDYERPTYPWPSEDFDATHRVTARAGKRARVELALLEPVPMRLHFERDDGTPVTNVTLQAIASSGAVLHGTHYLDLMNAFAPTPDSRGDALVSLYPGHYVRRVSEGVAMRDVAFDVPRDGKGAATLKVPSLGPTGSLRGRVVDELSGAPIVWRDVLASQRRANDDVIELGMATTDAQGRFEFAELPIGTIDLLIRGGGHGGNGRWQVDDEKSPYGLASQHASISAGTLTNVEFTLPPVHSKEANFPKLPVAAQVTDAATQQPLSNVTLDLYAFRGDGDLFVGTLHTDAAGAARAELFAAERYRIVAFRHPDPSTGLPAYPEQEFTATVKDGALSVVIALAPAK